MNWLYKRNQPVYSRRLRRRLQGKHPSFGERFFPWHEERRVDGVRLVLAVLIVMGLLAGATGGAVTAAGYSFYSKDLPSVDLLFDRPIPQSTLIYDRDGNLLLEVYDPDKGRRLLTPLSEMGQNIVDATLAAEDPNFYYTPGLDPMAVLRAFVQNFQSGGIVSGASTLSMQLVRNALFDEAERFDRSYVRKIREAILSVNLTMRYSKDEILEMYLNEVYYGNQAYGVQAASLAYFGKPVKDLDLAEAAILAGLPQAPTDYNPYTNPQLAALRQHYVLDQMAKFDFISQEEADEAKNTPVYLDSLQTRFDAAPHFAYYVRDLLVSRFGYEKVYYGGLRVVTSLDLEMQQIAAEKAREHVATLQRSRAGNASVVSIDPRTGELLVMVGSVNFQDGSIDGQVNMAIAERQPGSSIKPFTYMAAFQKLGYVPATLVNDAPIAFPQRPGLPAYRPMNWNFKFNGVVPLREALGASMNIPAVLLLANVGVPSFIETVHEAGITTFDRPVDDYGLAITLGAAEVRPIDITFAYTVFANNGKLIGALLPEDEQRPGYAPYEPVILKKVSDYKGEVLYEHTPQPAHQVVPAEYAYMVTAALSDDEARVLTYGRNSFLNLSRPSAAKTGTTEYRQDGWTVGYTPDLVTGVWIGNADNTPMIDVAGVSGAGRIWHNFMEEVLKDRPKVHFTVPSNIREGQVCGRYDVYVEGRQPVCHAGASFAPIAAPTASTPAQTDGG